MNPAACWLRSTLLLLIAGALAFCLEACRPSEAHRRMAQEHLDRGISLSEKDLFHQDRAIAEFREAIKLDPDSAVAHLNLGKSLQLKNDVDGAMAEYRTAIRLDGSMAEAHLRTGDILRSRHKDLDGAIREFRLAVTADPNSYDAHQHLAIALQQKGDTDGAIAEFRELVRLGPDDTSAHYMLGQALRAKGDLASARAESQKAELTYEETARVLHIGDASEDRSSGTKASTGATSLEPKPSWPNLDNGTVDSSELQPGVRSGSETPAPTIDYLLCASKHFRALVSDSTGTYFEFDPGSDIACLAIVDPPTRGLEVEWRWITEHADSLGRDQVLYSKMIAVGSGNRPNTVEETFAINRAGSYRLELYLPGSSTPAGTYRFGVGSPKNAGD